MFAQNNQTYLLEENHALSKAKMLVLEDSPPDSLYCPFCKVALEAWLDVLTYHHIPHNRRLEVINIDSNPSKLKEIRRLLSNSNLPNVEISTPLLIYDGVVRVGIVTKKAYSTFLLGLIFGHGYRRSKR